MKPLFQLALGEDAELLLNFKERALTMSDAEMREVYAAVARLANARPTDLSAASVDAILAALDGNAVLEVGCGRGFLAARMAEMAATTAVDFVCDAELRARHPSVRFVAANVEHGLPFRSGSFPTVVCTHTLEHLRNVPAALAELRRVASRRLILVVPSQRPYRYTFDLHIHFFPYVESFLAVTGTKDVIECRKIDGDIFCVEDRSSSPRRRESMDLRSR